MSEFTVKICSDGDDAFNKNTTYFVCVPRVRSSEARQLKEGVSRIKVGIEGMTCLNCEKNIEKTIGERPGVIHIKVNLKEEAGYIEYKTDETTPQELAEAIENMGFTVSLPKSKNNGNSSKPAVSDIHVEGMTCQSCVKTVTGELI